MSDGDIYVLDSQNSLYRLPNFNCSEGDTVTLSDTPAIQYVYLNGHLISSGSTTLTSFPNSDYICHIYNDSILYTPDSMILPATLIMLCFFSIIFHWFLRLRG